MDDNKILEILSHWNFWGEGLDMGIERKISNKIYEMIFGINKIISIYGIRRSGKSYILRQIDKKLSDKIGKENILYINFEEAGFPEKLDKDFLIKIYEVYKKYLKPNNKPVIILDEIQEVENWEKFVRTLNERNECYIIISGSSSKLMSEELSTILAGRTISIEIFTLSFEEFLSFKNFNNFYNIGKLKDYLLEYIEFGGFPEVILENNKNKKEEIVRDYFNTIILKDVGLRFKIKNLSYLESLARFIISNPSNYLSFKRLSRELKVPEKTLQRYFNYLESSRSVFSLKKFSYSVKEQERSIRKIYIADTSLHNILGFKLSENIGKLMENIVAIELFRRKSYFDKNYEIYYFKNNYEIDFLIKENNEITKLINVTYANNYDEIDKREIRSLIHGYDLFKEHNPELIIITWDYEDEKDISWFNKKGKIKFIPLWKWLLNI
ncbi:ATPase AAA [Nanoarchaeota archaeon]